METFVLATGQFSSIGHYAMVVLLVLSCLAGLSGAVNLFHPRGLWQRETSLLLFLTALLFLLGFVWICWFHYEIYRCLPLELPGPLAEFLNDRLAAMNRRASYALPLYDSHRPPRYAIPVWIENEKYYFWFMCYAFMVLAAQRRVADHRVRGALNVLLAGHAVPLYFAADPFAGPLPQFFAEVAPWFQADLLPARQLALFMRLYPRMTFYYNATYMWFHPPLLFLAYGAITVTFVTSLFILFRKHRAVEEIGYDFGKLGYLLLTLGMLLGYPWALQAWGDNWWWDPKVCSSIVMWVVFTAYLHTRIHLHRRGMWHFSAALGILCFLSMIFAFVTSFYFPGAHTLQ